LIISSANGYHLLGAEADRTGGTVGTLQLHMPIA